jgi:predicted transposase YdaD
MAKPFDATTKDLLESDPVAWMAYLGLHPHGAVEVIDSDLSTVTAEADKVFRVVGPESYLVHVEMQSSADITLPRRLLRYNVLLDHRHKMRVWSIAVLLRPEAEAATLTGSLDLRLPDGQKVHDFRYGVVRAWRQSAEAVLQGPLSILPMALLADVPPEAARTVLQRIDERLVREATEPEAARLMNSTLLLAGLRFEKETLAQLVLGVQTMNLLDSKILKDSSAYHLLEELMRPELEKEIRVKEARSILVNQATRRFGEPTETQKAFLDGITDHDRLFRLCENVVILSSWDELLGSESPS